jgi:hypothetical protein
MRESFNIGMLLREGLDVSMVETNGGGKAIAARGDKRVIDCEVRRFCRRLCFLDIATPLSSRR